MKYLYLLIVSSESDTSQETLRQIKAIEVPATELTKEIAREIYSKIKERQNKHTGQTALFVNRAFKKIISHNGFDKRVMFKLAEAYENAVFMYNEPVDVEHKIHTNFTGYSHYVAKISINKHIIYARFTLENLKTKPGKRQISQFHSVHLSYELKNNAIDSPRKLHLIKTATWGANGTTDLKLQQWLNFVK